MPDSLRRDGHLALLVVGLLAVLALQLSLTTGLSAAWWAHIAPSALIDPAVVIRAVVLVLAVVQSLRWLARPHLPLPTGLGIVLGLAGLFRIATLRAPIGDWQVLIWAAQSWQTIGKWYGSSLVIGGFHHLLGAPIGLSAEESVMLCSSLCGALLLLVLGRTAARLRLPADAFAWRGALAAGFASYGLALGHREIYSLVLLAVAFTIERWIALAGEPNTKRAVWAGAALGIALTLYLGAVGLVPAALACLGWLISRGALRAAAIATLSSAVLCLAILKLGPPTFERSLVEEWQRQAARGHVLNETGRPYFLPPDVHWSLITNFVAPRYWLAWWHLRDLIGSMLFAAPLTVPLTLCGLLQLLRSPRRALQQGGWLGLAAALSFAVIGALVVPGIPLPWDWDLFAFYFTPLSWWTALYVAAELEPIVVTPRWRTIAFGIWCCFSVCLALAMFRTSAQPPTEFGPAQNGISMGASPERLPVGGKPFVWLWIRNGNSYPIEIRAEQVELRLVETSGREQSTSETVRLLLRGSRRIPPGTTVPLTHLFWIARAGPLVSGAEAAGRRARWQVRVQVEPPHGSGEWVSQELELVQQSAMVQ